MVRNSSAKKRPKSVIVIELDGEELTRVELDFEPTEEELDGLVEEIEDGIDLWLDDLDAADADDEIDDDDELEDEDDEEYEDEDDDDDDDDADDELEDDEELEDEEDE